MSRSHSAPDPAGADLVEDHRRRPRRRGATLDAAILEATIADIEESGYPNLSMERVAERARTGKASLYRRWPNKVELVMTALYTLFPDPAAATDTGSLRGDLLAQFRSAAGLFAGPAGAAIRGLISEALRDPEQAGQLRSFTRGRSVQAMRETVRRAAERGELVAESITPRQLEAGLSLLRFHLLTHDDPVPDEVIVEIVDEIVLPLFGAAVDGGKARAADGHPAIGCDTGGAGV